MYHYNKFTTLIQDVKTGEGVCRALFLPNFPVNLNYAMRSKAYRENKHCAIVTSGESTKTEIIETESKMVAGMGCGEMLVKGRCW